MTCVQDINSDVSMTQEGREVKAEAVLKLMVSHTG